MARITQRQKDLVGRLPTTEEVFFEYVKKLSLYRHGRRAVIIRLSRIPGIRKRDQRVIKSVEAFNKINSQLKGQAFLFFNADIAVILKDSARSEIEKTISDISFLFADDNAVSMGIRAGTAGGYVDWYVFSRDYDILLSMAETYVKEGLATRDKEMDLSSGRPSQKAKLKEPLTGTILARLEKALSRSDISSLRLSQSIVSFDASSQPRRIYYELFISINNLSDTISPTIDLFASPWLFQQLTETLDRRILHHIKKQEDRKISHNFTINLNIRTLMSEDFIYFDRHVSDDLKKTIVIEIQAIDIFSDIGSFIAVRNLLHHHGYLVCVDGVRPDTIPFIDRKKMGIDLVKVLWRPSLSNSVLSDGSTFSNFVNKTGKERVILAHCDTKEAISFGRSVGINLFQGWHIESLVPRK